MSKGAAFFKKYAWVTFALLALDIFFCNALGMIKTGAALMAFAVISLMSTLLIPAVRHDELHLRGCIYTRKETPIAFNVMFCVLSAVSITGIVMLFLIIFSWD